MKAEIRGQKSVSKNSRSFVLLTVLNPQLLHSISECAGVDTQAGGCPVRAAYLFIGFR